MEVTKKRNTIKKRSAKTDLKKNSEKKKTTLDYNDPLFLLEVEGLARDGYDDQQIASIFDVVPETFSRNKKKPGSDGAESQLSQALRKGRRPLSVLVENALYKRAIGGFRTKSILRKWMVVDGKSTPVEIIQETETEMPPDTNAIGMWLRAHKAEQYNPVIVQAIDHTTNGKDLKQLPVISKIEHVFIASDQLTSNYVDI
jgi:hypothetical protein